MNLKYRYGLLSILLLSACSSNAMNNKEQPNHVNQTVSTYKILLNHDEGDYSYNKEIKKALDDLRRDDNFTWSYSITYQKMPMATEEEKSAYLDFINENDYAMFTAPTGYKESLVQTGKVVDLTSYLDAANFASDKATPRYQYYNNKIYTIPYKPLNYGVIYYNVDIFEKLNLSIPKTKKDFLNVCQKIKEYEATMNEEAEEEVLITPFAASVGSDIRQTAIFLDGLAMTLDKDAPEKLAKKEIDYSNYAYKEAISLYEEMLQKGYIDYATSAAGKTYSALMQDLSTGRVAMVAGFSKDYKSFSNATFNASRMMYFPALDNNVNHYGKYIPHVSPILEGLMVSKNAPDAQTATKIAVTFSKAYGKFFYNFGDTRIPLYDPTENNWSRICVQPFDGIEEFILNQASKVEYSTFSPLVKFQNYNYVMTGLAQKMLYDYCFSPDTYNFQNVLNNANTLLSSAELNVI